MKIMKDNQGVIVFKGNLVVSTIDAAHSQMEKLLDEMSPDVVIDLSDVDDIDLAGLQFLTSLKKTFENDSSLHIRAVNASVMERIVLSGFNLTLREALS